MDTSKTVLEKYLSNNQNVPIKIYLSNGVKLSGAISEYDSTHLVLVGRECTNVINLRNVASFVSEA